MALSTAGRCALAGLVFIGIAQEITEARCQTNVMVFTRDSFVDTKFSISEIAGKAHSISFRFKFHYPNAATGRIIGLINSNNGFYQIGKTGVASSSTEQPLIEVKIGPSASPTVARFFGPDSGGFVRNKWYHLTMTVDASRKMLLYIDGKPANTAATQLPPAPWGSGKLRFGLGDPLEQFYGELDKVAIWNHALDASEIAAIMQKFTTGSEPAVLAAWDFEGVAMGDKGLLASWTSHGALLNTGGEPPSLHATKLSLPVRGKWRITQGIDSGRQGLNSHRGLISFCLDMVQADGPTEGQPILAPADGKVVLIRDTTPNLTKNVPGCSICGSDTSTCQYISNQIIIEHGPREYTEYLHFLPNSVPPWIKDKLRTGALVKRGQVIGLAGQSGNATGPHLHFCMGWATFFQSPVVNPSGKDDPIPFNLLTGACGYKPAVANPVNGLRQSRPFRFSDYELVDGSSHKLIAAGTPQVNETIKAPDVITGFLLDLPGGAFLRAVHSDKCAQVSNASPENGAPVTQWDCVHLDNVRWMVSSAGDDSHFFIRAQHSGKCLHVANASTENGAAITQFDCVNQDNVKWNIQGSPGGYFIKAKHSGKCLHVPDGSIENRVAFTQFECVDQDNVKWTIQ